MMYLLVWNAVAIPAYPRPAKTQHGKPSEIPVPVTLKNTDKGSFLSHRRMKSEDVSIT